MKRFTPLALVVLALAVVPQALGDDGTTPAQPAAPTTTASTAPPTQQRPTRPVLDPTAAGTTAARPAVERPHPFVQNLRKRVHAWVRHCIARTGRAPERCYERIKKILERLGNLDDMLQSTDGENALDQAAQDLGQLSGSSG